VEFPPKGLRVAVLVVEVLVLGAVIAKVSFLFTDPARARMFSSLSNRPAYGLEFTAPLPLVIVLRVGVVVVAVVVLNVGVVWAGGVVAIDARALRLSSLSLGAAAFAESA
jgi:hypothetical protein